MGKLLGIFQLTIRLAHGSLYMLAASDSLSQGGARMLGGHGKDRMVPLSWEEGIAKNLKTVGTKLRST
jgi:hypothetical protein